MKQKNLEDLTDEEILTEAKKIRLATITNALLIGFLIGILIYSTVVNKFGFLTLILLFAIYKLVNKPKKEKDEIKKLLKERNLEW